MSKAEELNSLVDKLLKELDQSPDKVAKLLEDKGIKGQKCNVRYCPISNYIREEIKHILSDATIITGFDSAHLVHKDNYVIPGTKIIHFSDNVKGFIKEFDIGHFPNLEEELLTPEDKRATVEIPEESMKDLVFKTKQE